MAPMCGSCGVPVHLRHGPLCVVYHTDLHTLNKAPSRVPGFRCRGLHHKSEGIRCTFLLSLYRDPLCPTESPSTQIVWL